MKSLLFPAVFLFSLTLMAQKPLQGKVIPEYGPIFQVETSFKTDTTQVMKVVFDITKSEDPSSPNRFIGSVARFLNMHEMEGVPVENMHLAIVLHGQAITDILTNEAYQEHFPEAASNPNLPLLKALKAQHVEIIACGQSLAMHHIKPDQLAEEVDVALSAMTALVQLQNQGYQLLKF
ncbi:MAG: DsrE family protein [Bacteroidota bacterium]|nr:DsrE family protein [Bacteroidota bacterium]